MTDSTSSRSRAQANTALGWLVVLTILAGAYLVINLGLPRIVTGSLAVYVLQPIVWCSVIAAVLVLSRRGTAQRLEFSTSVLGVAALLAGLQVAALIVGGLLEGFGHSPYSHTPLSILQDFFFWGTALVAMEIARAHLMAPFKKRHTMTMLVVISLTFTALMLPLRKYSSIQEPMPFLGGTALPLLAENLLATFLALAGGPIAAITFRAIIVGFEWLSPILPDLPWIMKAFLGTLPPVIGLLVIQSRWGENEPEATTPQPLTKRKMDDRTRQLIRRLEEYERLRDKLGAMAANLDRQLSKDRQVAEELALAGASPPAWKLRQLGHEHSQYGSLLSQQTTLAQKIAAIEEELGSCSDAQAPKQQVSEHPKTKNSSHHLFWGILGIVAVATIFFITGALGFRPVVVASGSMRPMMDVGDIAIVREVPAQSIQVGDVIQYRDGSIETMHRVVEISDGGGKPVFITQGDANNAPDTKPVVAEQVIGKVRFDLPKVGWISIWVKSLFS